MSNTDTLLVDNPQALDEARRGVLSGRAILDTLQESTGNAHLYPAPPGTGKSYAIDDLVAAVIESNAYGLVIMAAPTLKILKSSRILKLPEFATQGVLLQGRPRERCGESMDRAFREHEATGTVMAAKRDLCPHCENRGGCPWVEQMDRLVPGVRVVMLAQAYLEVNPGILGSILRRTGERAPLVILDEVNFLQVPFRRVITLQSIRNYTAVLRRVLQRSGYTESQGQQITRVLEDLSRLVHASPADLCSESWKFYPLERLSVEVQRTGLDMFGSAYKHLEFDLVDFSRQDSRGRRRDASGGSPGIGSHSGDISFNSLPQFENGGSLLVCSATASRDLLAHRLGIPFRVYAEHVRVRHRESTFFNLNLGTGLRRHHREHLPEMCHFAVSYAVRELRQGRLTAFVTKLEFLGETVAELNAFFTRFHLDRLVKAVPLSQWRHVDFAAIQSGTEARILLPVLHYGGAIGFNELEELENVVCLCGYYVRKSEVNRLLNEVVNPEEMVECTIGMTNYPRRRTVSVSPRDPYMAGLAGEVIEQEELGTVLQTVSRVRPFTKPRAVITCQCGESQAMPYDIEFKTLKQARTHFGVNTPKQDQDIWRNFLIHLSLRQGLTQPQIAEKLGIGERTVNRHRKGFAAVVRGPREGGQIPPESVQAG